MRRRWKMIQDEAAVTGLEKLEPSFTACDSRREVVGLPATFRAQENQHSWDRGNPTPCGVSLPTSQ